MGLLDDAREAVRLEQEKVQAVESANAAWEQYKKGKITEDSFILDMSTDLRDLSREFIQFMQNREILPLPCLFYDEKSILTWSGLHAWLLPTNGETCEEYRLAITDDNRLVKAHTIELLESWRGVFCKDRHPAEWRPLWLKVGQVDKNVIKPSGEALALKINKISHSDWMKGQRILTKDLMTPESIVSSGWLHYDDDKSEYYSTSLREVLSRMIQKELRGNGIIQTGEKQTNIVQVEGQHFSPKTRPIESSTLLVKLRKFLSQ